MTNIDRLAAAHQKSLDDEAEEQARQEEAEESVMNDLSGPDYLEHFDHHEWSSMNMLIRKLVSQYQYHGEERNQGLLDVSQEILDLCYPAINKQAKEKRNGD